MNASDIKEEIPPSVREMDAILKQKFGNGCSGIRLFVSSNRDISNEDIARNFCLVEKAKPLAVYDEKNPLPF